MIERIDWWRVIVELGYAGYSVRRIADELIVSKSWLFNLKLNGHEPRHRDGEMLLALWAKATGKNVDQAPRDELIADTARTRARMGLK